MKSRDFLHRILVSEKPLVFRDLWVPRLFLYSNPRSSFVLGMSALVIAWYESLLKVWIPGNFVDIAPLILMATAFVVANKNIIRGKNIIIIDDILTTGTTLNECAKVLKEAGAKKVWGLVLARG